MTEALLMLVLAYLASIRGAMTQERAYDLVSLFWLVAAGIMSCIVIADVWGWL